MLPWIRKNLGTRKIAIAFFAIMAVFLFLFTHFLPVFAQENPDIFGTQPIQENISLSGTDIRIIVVKIIRAVLALLGFITLGLILYAGFTIMTSGGNEEKVMRGKKTMINAVIGLVIILSAFSIVQFVLNALRGATTEPFPGGQRPPGIDTFAGTGALGTLIKDHYPRHEQTDVARNTSIVITFGVPVDPASFINNANRTCWDNESSGPTSTCFTSNGDPVTSAEDEISNEYFGDCLDIDQDGNIEWETECDRLNSDAIHIYMEENVENAVDSYALASYDEAGRVFDVVFKPVEYLGSLIDVVMYRVDLTQDIVRSDTGDGLFDGRVQYWWIFETGTSLDLDPPHVESVYPDSEERGPFYKNTIIQVNFDEAIDPTTVQGKLFAAGSFDNVLLNTLINDISTTARGNWRLSNGYRTLEFIPDDPCGTNSCGETMYCLEVDCSTSDTEKCSQPYKALLRTGTPTNRDATAPYEVFPFSGVYDLAFNGLDNESDNATSNALQKPPEVSGKIIDDQEEIPDNYFWSFPILNDIDRSIPYISDVFPKVDGEDISEFEQIYFTFSRRMMASSLSDIAIVEYPERVCSYLGYVTSTNRSELIDFNANCEQADRMDVLGYRIRSSLTDNLTTQSYIVPRRPLGPNNLDLYYFPSVPSSVKSSNQQCIYPGRGPSGTDGQGVSHCTVQYDKNGNITNQENCVRVSMTTSTQDTGCAYLLPGGDQLDAQTDVPSCIIHLEDQSSSQYVD